jgi:hypothetical protein
MVMEGLVNLINNTITQNVCVETDTVTQGAGLFVLSYGTLSGSNNIVFDNYATTNPEFFGTIDFTYSCSSAPLTGTGNYQGNPQFVGPVADDFHLTAGSPCVDAGSPASPLDPDGSRADMGALYYDHLTAPPDLEVTMTPVHPPIVIQTHGGSFQFTISMVNHGPVVPYFVWAQIIDPNGTGMYPMLGPIMINTPLNVTIGRTRNQTVPASWIPGLYTYRGYVNLTYMHPVIDSSSFTFTKLATADSGPMVWEASCAGDPFPGQVVESTPQKFAMLGASPNPFNPMTTISFTLPEAEQVKLTVYDMNGRALARLAKGMFDVGAHEVIFDGSGLASGLYLCCLQAGDASQIIKMVLLK